MPSMGSETDLLGQIRPQPPLWGIASGETVPDWCGVWMAGPADATIDWTPFLKSVSALTFYAEFNQKVEFHLTLDFSNREPVD